MAIASAAAAKRSGFKSMDDASAMPAENTGKATLRGKHVPIVLRTLAESVGADPKRVAAFLREFQIPEAAPPTAADGPAVNSAAPPVMVRMEIGGPHRGGASPDVSVRMAMLDSGLANREVKSEEISALGSRLLEYLGA